MIKKIDFINGKWNLSPRARESGEFELRNGDWYPKSSKKQKPTSLARVMSPSHKPKLKKKVKKMHCGAFPLGKIKEFCKTATLHLLSGALGISLAINIFLYMEKRTLEINNLKLLEALKQSGQLK